MNSACRTSRSTTACVTAAYRHRHRCGVGRRGNWTSAEYAEILKGFKKRG